MAFAFDAGIKVEADDCRLPQCSLFHLTEDTDIAIDLGRRDRRAIERHEIGNDMTFSAPGKTKQPIKRAA